MKRAVPVLLILLMLGTNSGVPMALCGGSSRQAAQVASTHCKMSEAALPSMSCCRAGARNQGFAARKELANCCHVSNPLPVRSQPAVPAASSSEDLRIQARGLVAVVAVAIHPLLTASSPPDTSAIVFRSDRSDTYLQSSCLRI
ncbi:MAG: hypothetical protein FJW26_02240 [Acidimicrobiia bacterium]|nr:hypothetical protein [Acidimicrobiia bacterium]